jgi:hypothetical protein
MKSRNSSFVLLTNFITQTVAYYIDLSNLKVLEVGRDDKYFNNKITILINYLNMEISVLYMFLALYGAGVLIFLVLTFFNLYHAWRFGMSDLANMLSMITYIILILIIAIASYSFLGSVDWSNSPTINIFSF